MAEAILAALCESVEAVYRYAFGINKRMKCCGSILSFLHVYPCWIFK